MLNRRRACASTLVKTSQRPSPGRCSHTRVRQSSASRGSARSPACADTQLTQPSPNPVVVLTRPRAPVPAHAAEPRPGSSAHLAPRTGALLLTHVEARPAYLIGAAAIPHPDAGFVELPCGGVCSRGVAPAEKHSLAHILAGGAAHAEPLGWRSSPAPHQCPPLVESTSKMAE
ncbi:hypothetical protein SETIT_2G188100v2 [Setaria italica]|uniref:Uncharacterized protein n=1 Tax=Setaria italica TaxID=4555 RepID=A0A368Q2M0_SETIT|nr:hypothetical protein SETIT_2G188100v2 [Setaria italica]